MQTRGRISEVNNIAKTEDKGEEKRRSIRQFLLTDTQSPYDPRNPGAWVTHLLLQHSWNRTTAKS